MLWRTAFCLCEKNVCLLDLSVEEVISNSELVVGVDFFAAVDEADGSVCCFLLFEADCEEEEAEEDGSDAATGRR